MEQRELDTPNKDKGFTLVELLIVVVILGILATVVVFSVRGITSEAETAGCDADERTLQTAIEAYAAENEGALPANEAALVGGEYLQAESDKWNFTVSVDGESYSLTAQDTACAPAVTTTT